MSALTHEKLWEHPSPQTTKTHEFKRSIEQKYGVQLEDYESLRQWSTHNLAQFWEEVWHFTGIRASAPFTKVGLKRDPIHNLLETSHYNVERLLYLIRQYPPISFNLVNS